jgi:hypothetical protein
LGRRAAEVVALAETNVQAHQGRVILFSVEAGPAILLLRWTISGRVIDEDLARHVVDDVMLPLLSLPK